MGAVVANAWSVEPWRHARDVKSGRAVRTVWTGVGRIEHEDRAATGVSSRNDHDVAGGTGEALVDATLQPFSASNRMKQTRVAVEV